MSRTSTRTATKDLLKEVNLIKEKTVELRKIVDGLPDSSVKDAFQYSVINLEKKIEKFTTVSVPLTDEQKERLRKFRESLMSENKTEISQIQNSDVKKKKK